ncbi:MAG: HAD family hydrolase [Mycoplasmataceae bacterium]|nr:HAD family hydrolase [Mycoplasmataceae bacterium]
MVKGILFDIGGTIFTSDKVENENKGKAGSALLQYLQKHDIMLECNKSGAEIAAMVKAGQKAFKDWAESNDLIDIYPFDLFTKWIFTDLSEKEIESLKIIANQAINVWKINGGGWIRHDSIETLKKLHAAGYKLGIISNTDSLDFVTMRLYNNGIHQYFDCVYLSCMSQCRKPNKNIFLEACKDLDCTPDEVVYVGDTISRDVIGSNNAGLKACIRIKTASFHELSVERYKDKDTQYVIEEFAEIVDIITSMK